VNVVVGDARRGACAIHRLAFELLQAQLGGQQLGFDLRAQVLRPLAGLVAGALQEILGLREHRGEIVEQRFAGEVHGLLLGWMAGSGGSFGAACFRGGGL
jgi:hypothetical protein